METAVRDLVDAIDRVALRQETISTKVDQLHTTAERMERVLVRAFGDPEDSGVFPVPGNPLDPDPPAPPRSTVPPTTPEPVDRDPLSMAALGHRAMSFVEGNKLGVGVFLVFVVILVMGDTRVAAQAYDDLSGWLFGRPVVEVPVPVPTRPPGIRLPVTTPAPVPPPPITVPMPVNPAEGSEQP